MSSALARARKQKEALRKSQELKESGVPLLGDKENRRRNFARTNGSVLFIVFFSGETKEVFLADKIMMYCDLQREIAKVTPGKNGIFVIQNSKGEFISSNNFEPANYFKVKEIDKKNVPIIYPLVPTKWEFKKYHGAPRDWIDPLERKRREEEELLRIAEEKRQQALLAEELARQEAIRKEEERNLLLGDEEDWDNMLNA